MTAPALVWFRQDLRLADNPALIAAAAGGRPVLPLFVLDDEAPGRWRLGGAARWWLHHSLDALGRAIGARGGRLVLRRGLAAAVIDELIAAHRVEAVCWNRRYEPWAVAQDRAIKAALTARGVAVRSFKASLVREPWEVAEPPGIRVFSPFHRRWLALGLPDAPLPVPDPLRFVGDVPGDPLSEWELLPTKPDWAQGLREAWRPGEAGAWQRAEPFLAAAVGRYGSARHRPDRDGVSRLSPHLHFGEISPRALVHRAGLHTAFARQLAWREFAAQLLFYQPDLPELELQPALRGFPWRDDPAALRAWQRGRTGWPMVDAGMRELRRTGWMHNRARMITASLLVKHLLIDWRAGQDWFWDNLVDADLASNAMNWQWVAGTGTDTRGFARIFNPVKQGAEQDPQGVYVRRWVPELANVPDAWVHRPHEAPPEALDPAACRYPRPIVDLVQGRARAMAAYEAHLGRAALFDG